MLKLRFSAVVLGLTLLMTACKKETNNKLPKADAGVSQTVTLPVESVSLTGTGTDQDGKIVTYLWAQVSGPSASVIVDPGAPSTVVQGLIKGVYVFQLSVFDNLGGIGTDTTSITVSGATAGTITLQPANNPGEFSLCEIGGIDRSGPPANNIGAWAWTYNGASYTLRELLKFDLSAIPSTATISSAHLFLYSDPAPVSGDQHNANSGDNGLYIQQVASDWSTTSAGWFNQPTGITSNQVIVPSTTQGFLDIDVNVTAVVAPMVSQHANYGFLIKLVNEQIYAARQFVGSHQSQYPDKYPKLVIQYN